MSLNKRNLRENRLSDSHNLLTCVNKFLLVNFHIYLSIWVKLCSGDLRNVVEQL